MNAIPVRLRCLVVDDEPLARRVIAGFVQEHPLLELAGSCKDALEALTALGRGGVDLLFLDVQMPTLSGLGLLRALSDPPAVVLTTAHGEHAVEAFDLAVSDYLLKPVGRERFLRAVDRVLAERRARPAAQPAAAPAGSIFVRVDQGLVKLELDDVACVEACENYVRFHTARRAYLTKRTIADVEAMLPGERFVRVHRSWLVRIDAIERLEGNVLTVAGREVPVSRSHRAALLERLRIA